MSDPSTDARICADVLELIEDHDEAHIQTSDINTEMGKFTRLHLEVAVAEKNLDD